MKFNAEMSQLTEKKAVLYKTIKSLDFIEKLYADSSINKETYLNLCGEEYDRYKIALHESGYATIDEFFNEYDLDKKSQGYRRCVDGCPVRVEQKVIKSGKTLIEMVENIMKVNELKNRNVRESKQYFEYVSELNFKIKAFECKSKDFDEKRRKLNDLSDILYENLSEENLSDEIINDLSSVCLDLLSILKSSNE